MSASSLESAGTWRAWIAGMAAADPRARRFGARQHRYRVGEPLGEERVRALEGELGVALPDDHRAFVTSISGGGAGPYHGLLPLDHPLQRRCAAGAFALTRATADADVAVSPFAGVIVLGHVGCEQVVLLVVRGAAAGQVWLDARASGGGVAPIAPSFGTYVQDWIERCARNQPPRALVPPGSCALPASLSAYLARCERDRGLPPGALAGEALRAALGALGRGAIRIEAIGEGPCFAPGEPVDPCPSCEVLLENLRGRGLATDAVAAGTAPIQAREDVF